MDLVDMANGQKARCKSWCFVNFSSTTLLVSEFVQDLA